MHAISKQELTRLLAVRGLVTSRSGVTCDEGCAAHVLRVAAHDESTSKVIALTSLLAPDAPDRPFQGAVLWVRVRGIWGDVSEAMGEWMLRAMVPSGSDSEAFLFNLNPKEVTECRACLLLVLLFGWDADLLPLDAEWFFKLDHHRMVTALARSEVDARELSDRFQYRSS